jgi:hypothetical protein
MDAKQESEKLMNSVLPVAQKMLRDFGEFYPYGGYMELDGAIVDVGVEDPDTDHPQSKDMIDALRSTFQERAQAKQCRAIAIVFDVALRSPGSDKKRDAIQISIEHRDDYAVEVFFPYEIVNKEVIYGEIFAQKRKREIFVKR